MTPARSPAPRTDLSDGVLGTENTMYRRLVCSLLLICSALMMSAFIGVGRARGRPDARPPSAQGELAHVRSWAFAIGTGDLNGDVAARYVPFDLVVLDGDESTPRQVAALHGQATIVLAYLDVGTIEPGRPWSDHAKPFRLDYWKDWGEWFADVSQPGYRNLIARDVAPALLAKGFDGLFLDNIDMVSDHRAQTAGMHQLVGALSQLVHGESSRRRFLFAQNGEDVVGPMLRYLDGWNREDVTATYDFDRHRYVHQPPSEVRANLAALRRVRRAGVLVTATDYLAANDRAGAAQATRNACAAGALPFQSDISLRRIPTTALRCTG